MTLSIVARDAETEDLGVAVHTAWFGVGRSVPWAEPRVGAVATQSFTEHSYGPLGLRLMRAGRSARAALAKLVAMDAGERFRQVGIVDACGEATAHTGASCVRDAGHYIGDGYSVQANMMQSERVWPAMADAYETASGTLARRMLAALDSGQSAGGDFRGGQSAALLVVPGQATAKPWSRLFDLRVEDHPEPLVELKRLLEIDEAYAALAIAQSGRAALAAPLREKDRIWAAALDAAYEDDVERARKIIQALFDAEPHWRDSVRAYGERGLFPHWQRVLE